MRPVLERQSGDHQTLRRGRHMPQLTRAVALVLAVGVAHSGCAASARRDLDARERERVAAETNAERACEGVSPDDIAPGVSEFEVIRLAVLGRRVRYKGDVVEGAAAVIATKGRSFGSLDRLMRCRAARAAVARDPSDPLAVPGASVRVLRDDGDAAIVQIRSRVLDQAQEIVRRLSGTSPEART